MAKKKTSARSSRSAQPHRLELYENAVQQPFAEAAFLERVHRHYNPGQAALLLREDFAGTCAVAAAWCMSHPEHQAMAVDHHGPTLCWAKRRHADVLDDLHIVEADVMSFDRPRVDVVAALNFSTFIYHAEADLLGYLRHARKCLRPGGCLVLDAYGGPGAQRLGTQTRPADGFTYHWEQRSFNPVTHRTDCRIHFTPPGKSRRQEWMPQPSTPQRQTPQKQKNVRRQPAHAEQTSPVAAGPLAVVTERINSAFRYDWRLWTLPELTGLMAQAGFAEVLVWASTKAGRYRPAAKMPAAEDWVVYVTGRR